MAPDACLGLQKLKSVELVALSMMPLTPQALNKLSVLASLLFAGRGTGV